MQQWQAIQGAAWGIVATLEDAAGVVINASYPGGGYTGNEPLVTSIWPGGNRAVSVLAATTWSFPGDPALGLIAISLTADQTAVMFPGSYQLLTDLTDVDRTAPAYEAQIEVLPGPVSFPPPPTSDRITRQPVEAELVDRNSALLILLGKSTMADGQNPAMTGPLGFSLQMLGVTPAIPGTVTDADLAKLDPSQYFILCDLAGYLLLRNCLNGFAQPDQSSPNGKQNFNAMMRRFKTQMDAMEKQYASYLGRYRSVLSSGSIALGPPSRNYWNYNRSGSDFRGSDY
jgi:hypothetical protein